jgi:serine/threonine protein phosphatase PrpC
VGGDIYWLKQFRSGTVLCVCDCTGHGTPGALLTALVVSAFEDMVNESNCHDTALVMWNLEKRLTALFDSSQLSGEDSHEGDGIKDGCDLAVIFISNDKSVTVSSGNTHVFICDGDGVQVVKGQKIFVGEGRIKNKDAIKMVNIPANPNNKFYIASDGLFEQPGGEHLRPYGYKEFKWIILENHNKPQKAVSDTVWEAYEKYRGDYPRVDDFQLITFKP